MNNLTQVKDANNNTTNYAYDLLSRLTSEQKPGGQATQYSYDADSRLSQRIDAKNQTTTYAYNNNDNLTGITYSDHSVSFGVDSNGNILTVNDSSVYGSGNLYDNRYDKLNRLIWQRNNFENAVTAYQYDSYGNKTAMGVTAGTNTYNWTYTYNGLNQLISMTDSCGHTTSYDYKNSGRLKDKYLPNGITGAYSYYANGDINTLQYKAGTTNVLNLNYSSYDNAHNILTQAINGVTRNFSYDNINQLVGVTGTQAESFTYDLVGNRLSSIDNPTWTYNTDNELMGYGATNMTYDLNGNMATDSGNSASLSYDYENRLASYITGSTTNYLYDPQGRRLQKSVNTVQTRYLWDGAMMIAELDGTNQVQRIYTYNPQTMEPVSTAIGCTAYFYITDHLMTPQMLTANNVTGTTVWYAQYSAFGTANVITSTVTNNLRFPGQYADAESRLYYNYYRYYMPEAGRYIERDPILQSMINMQFDSEMMLTPTNYVYVLNNPLKDIDFLGLLV